MKIKAFASEPTGDVRDGVGRVILTATTKEDVEFLTRLNTTLKLGEPIRCPADGALYYGDGSEGAESVRVDGAK